MATEERKCVMSDLIGKTVTGVLVNWGTRIIIFHSGGRSCYKCFDETWTSLRFHKILGIRHLIGRTVLDAQYFDACEYETNSDSELAYGIRLTTTARPADFIYCNPWDPEHQGRLVRSEHPVDLYAGDLDEVIDDFDFR